MKPSHELFELICSLSQTEKRFFKVYAGRHVIGKQNVYVRLFNAIARQKSYDEEKIIRQFKGEAFVKYFAAEKYYLYQMVLHSLDAYHSESSVEHRLAKMLHFAEILFKRSLYDQCGKILDRAEKIARTFERFPELEQVLFRRQSLIYHNPEISDRQIETYIGELFAEQDKVRKLQDNLIQYRRLSELIFAIYKQKGLARNTAELARLDNLMRHPLLKKESEAHSYDAARYFYGCHIIHCDAYSREEKSAEYSLRLIRLIESRPDRLEENPASYIAALNSYLITNLRLRRFELFGNTLRKLKELRNSEPVRKSMGLQLRLFEATATHQLDFHIKTRTYTDAMPAIRETEKELIRLGTAVDKAYRITIYHNMVSIYFGAGMFREALRKLNLIINEPGNEIREDLVCFARVINLIVHYELGNELQLPYLMRSAYRFLHKRNRVLRFEKVIFEHLRFLLRTRRESEIPGILLKLKKNLIPLLKEPYEKNLFEDIDLISWLDRKTALLQKKKHR